MRVITKRKLNLKANEFIFRNVRIIYVVRSVLRFKSCKSFFYNLPNAEILGESTKQNILSQSMEN